MVNKPITNSKVKRHNLPIDTSLRFQMNIMQMMSRMKKYDGVSVRTPAPYCNIGTEHVKKHAEMNDPNASRRI